MRDEHEQPADLVDQIYVRLVAAKDRDWRSRRHFFAIAARAMRSYLIDQLLAAGGTEMDLAIALDRLLNQLAETKPEWCTLVEVKYFLGLTDQEAAEALGIRIRTLQRMWRDAREWLSEQLESGPAQAD